MASLESLHAEALAAGSRAIEEPPEAAPSPPVEALGLDEKILIWRDGFAAGRRSRRDEVVFHSEPMKTVKGRPVGHAREDVAFQDAPSDSAHN